MYHHYATLNFCTTVSQQHSTMVLMYHRISADVSMNSEIAWGRPFRHGFIYIYACIISASFICSTKLYSLGCVYLCTVWMTALYTDCVPTMAPPPVLVSCYDLIPMTDAGQKDFVKCKFCDRKFVHNITRMREHLTGEAKYPGQRCSKVPPDRKKKIISYYM